MATLKKLAEAYKGKPYSYLWAEGGVQEKLEANFGVGGFGYPGGWWLAGGDGALTDKCTVGGGGCAVQEPHLGTSTSVVIPMCSKLQ